MYQESGVQPAHRSVLGGDIVGVGVAAESIVGLEQLHVVAPLQQVRRGQPGDAAPDDGHPLAG